MAATLLPSELAGSVLRHRLPTMAGPIVGEDARVAQAAPGLPTAREIEQIRQKAYDDAYAQAYAAREQELAQRAARLRRLYDELGAPLAALDDAVVERLAELAVLVARHLVRRELKHNPGEVVAVVREAMRQLPLATRRARIHLHPDDVELVQDALGLTGDTAWQLEPDPLLSRGGCIVETESSRIDAQVESRIAAIASKMFGGERESDRAT
jgi:flagellar assembly protein FliH